MQPDILTPVEVKTHKLGTISQEWTPVQLHFQYVLQKLRLQSVKNLTTFPKWSGKLRCTSVSTLPAGDVAPQAWQECQMYGFPIGYVCLEIIYWHVHRELHALSKKLNFNSYY